MLRMIFSGLYLDEGLFQEIKLMFIKGPERLV